MSITSPGSHVIADFQPHRVYGEAGLGCYRLKFGLAYSIHAWPDKALEFRNVQTEIYVRGETGSDFHFLGESKPEKPLLIRTSRHSITNLKIAFSMTLYEHQLEKIESMRNGEGLHFKLNLAGESFGDGRSEITQNELRLFVNQKEWLEVLKQIDYGEFLLFEIPVPSAEQSEELRTAVALMTQARSHFLLGNYGDAVATCRNVLESLAKALKEEKKQSQAKKQFKENEQSARAMTQEQRALLIRESVKHFSQLAHHPSSDGAAFIFNRKEALLMLGCTATLISFALQPDSTNSRKEFKNDETI